MITYDEAKAKAIEKMAELTEHNSQIVIWNEKTIVKPYGWYFIFVTKKFLETKNAGNLLPGIPPLLVEKDGKVDVLPTSVPIETYIKWYEEKKTN